jgi:regulatory protein
MKIVKYTKLKSNKYSVLIDDVNVKLYDDVIVKYELLRTKEIDEKLFKEIADYNDKLEAYYKSLKYITKKLRTEKEIYKYLEKDYDKKVIFETIDRLKKMGYLNEELYLKAYVSDQINMSLVGPNKIKKDLTALGYKEEDIIEYIDNIDRDVWISKIEKLVNKKLNGNRNLGVLKLKDKN